MAKDSISEELQAASDSFTRYDNLFKNYGQMYAVPWKWLKAICMNESSLGDAASVRRGLTTPTDEDGSKSSDGKSWGIMQLTLATARDYSPSAQVKDLNNPDFSVRIAARYISWLMRQFPVVETRYMEWVVKSYNQGRGNTSKERAGSIPGYAQEYWSRFQRNLALIERKQPEDK